MKGYYKKILSIFGLYVTLISMNIIYAQNNQIEKNSTEAILVSDEKKLSLNGKSTFVDFPSMYSIYLEFEKLGNCGIHISEMDRPLSLDLYEIKLNSEEKPDVGVVCVFEKNDLKERLHSDSGIVEIKDIGSNSISGSFEIILIGNISGIKYELSGTFDSTSRR